MGRKFCFKSRVLKFALCFSICLSVLQLSACTDVEDNKARYFKRGMEFYEQGNYTKARLEFKNVLQIDPKDAQGYYMFALVEEKEQNWRKSYALFLRATELDPNHVDALVHLGRLYALSGSSEKALASAEKALLLKPGDSSALIVKSLAQAKLGQKETAITLVERALKNDPGSVDGITLLASLYSDQGLLDKAVALIGKGLADNPDDVSLHLLMARFYDELGDTDESAIYQIKVIGLDPNGLSHRNRLAGYYHSKGLLEKAEQVLSEAIRLFPDSTDARLTLVTYLRQRGETDKSEQLLQGFIDQNPEAFVLQLSRANFLIGQGKKDLAMDVLNLIVGRAGDSESALKARTRKAALLLLDKRFAQASEQIKVVLDDEPKNIEGLLMRAGIALATNDGDKGIADLRTLLKEEPGNVRALRMKARAHIVKREMALAKQSLERAVESEPQEIHSNIELAQLLIQSGEYDASVDVLTRIQRFAPDDQSIDTAIIKIRAKQKKWSEVALLAEKIIQQYPEHAGGYYYKGLFLQANSEFKKSIAAFEQSLNYKSMAAEPLIAVAKSLLELGQSSEALLRVQNVIDQVPDHYVALNLKGEIYLTLKQWVDAKSSFDQAVLIKPDWDAPYRNLAKLSLYEKHREEALSYLKVGYEKSHQTGIGIDYAQLLQQSGDTKKARTIYESILEKQPDLPTARNNLAMLLISGDPDQSTLDRALELVSVFELSDNPLFLDSLGWVYFKRNELRNSIEILERATGLLDKREVPEINYHLAAAYASIERKDDAVKLLEAIVASGHQFDDKDKAKALLQQLL